MVSLSPKNYIVHCRQINETKDGRKGIPNYIDLTTEEFIETLYGEYNRNNRVEVRSLRLNKEKNMTRTNTMKEGLSSVHVKLQVARDRISCRPLQNSDGSFV